MLAQSEKICLRRLSPSDLTAFQAYRQDPEVARFQDWEPMSDERAKGFLAHVEQVDPLLRQGHWVQIAVADRATNDLMGDMGLFLSEDGTEAEVGITLARRHQRQGHSVVAMRMAMELVLQSTAAQRIICGADQRNTPSLAMIKRLGFRFTHSEDMPDGARVDDVFELQRDEILRL